MSVDLLKKVSNRFQQALIFHKESADIFSFLALKGFQQLHEHQLVEENNTQRKLKQFIVETYNQSFSDAMPVSAGVFELVADLNRLELDSEKVKEIVKQAWDKYRQWEADTLAEYERIGMLLLNEDNVKSYAFLQDIIVDVNNELGMLTNMIAEYNAIDWDMPEISGRQSELQDKYRKATKEIDFV